MATYATYGPMSSCVHLMRCPLLPRSTCHRDAHNIRVRQPETKTARFVEHIAIMTASQDRVSARHCLINSDSNADRKRQI